MKNGFHSLTLVTAFAAGFAAYGSDAVFGAETSSPATPLPTQADARAALMSQDPGLQNLSINYEPASAGNAAAPETTGRAAGNPQTGNAQTGNAQTGSAQNTNPGSAPVQIRAGDVSVAPGPIGATLQTMPAKFSKRNEILDRVPLMAWPLQLKQEQRQQIYKAIMMDEKTMATTAGDLAPAISLTAAQASQVRPMPTSLQEMPGMAGLGYLKTKDKVLLVRPEMRVVVDEITQS